MIVYLIIAGIGLLLLAIALLTDVDGLDGPDLPGVPPLVALGAGMGLAGAAGAVASSGRPWVAALLAVVTGLVATWLTSRLMTALRRASVAPDRDITGARATTTHTTGPKHGEVMVEAAGEHNKRLARTTGATLPAGTVVRVVAVEGSTVIVDPGPQDDPPPAGSSSPPLPEAPHEP